MKYIEHMFILLEAIQERTSNIERPTSNVEVEEVKNQN